jgi:antitoxin MazE
MIKKLTAIGNSLGIIIEKPILELLGIDKDTPLEVKTDGEALIIRPQRNSRSARLRQAADRMMEAHDETLKKLADRSLEKSDRGR